MSLAGNLYNIEEMTRVGNLLSCAVRIDSSSQIFKGHFPHNPILPGVCTLQIIGELLSGHLERKYTLTGSENIKFINLLNPLETPGLKFEITFLNVAEQQISIKCIVSGNGVEILKMKGDYECQQL